MFDWLQELAAVNQKGQVAVLVTVANIRGSGPREVGAKMIVTPTEVIGSIGGGQLEYQCTEFACKQFKDMSQSTMKRRYVLGSNCGQCCGGVVDVLFEFLPTSSILWLEKLIEHQESNQPAVIVTSTTDVSAKYIVTMDECGPESPSNVVDNARAMLNAGALACMSGEFLFEPIRKSTFNIVLFGAGHVGAATVDVLSKLDCNIRWIDSRKNIFPNTLPLNVNTITRPDPANEIGMVAPGAYYLVMTHSHPMDLDFCYRILRRDDISFCGLIGSQSKRRRFERSLKKQGIPLARLQDLVCPIGITGILGKKPTEIAVAVGAELLMARDQQFKEKRIAPLLEVLG